MQEYSLKRVLDLKSVQTVAPVTIKKHSFSFGIVTAKRTFLAKASSQDEMDDWVRAINSARRRLSEREEEERARRTGSAPVAVPARERPEAIDTHQGTYSSVFTSTAGSYTASPVATTSYFTSHPGAQPSHLGGTPLTSPTAIPPSSPMDITNSLTGQMAKMSMSPTTSSVPRMPPGRKISSASARREPSASSIGSLDHHPSALGVHALQPTVSSDEDEPYFSEPGAAFSAGMFSNPPNVQAAPVDPNKIILSAYLMKRSKGRGRKVWRKRWFYLTSQGLTYTKSHMVSRFRSARPWLTRRIPAHSASYRSRSFLTRWSSSQTVQGLTRTIPTSTLHPSRASLRKPLGSSACAVEKSVRPDALRPARAVRPQQQTNTSSGSSLPSVLSSSAPHQKRTRSSGSRRSGRY